MRELRKWCDGGMLAVDTNIVIRFLTRDDKRQAARSRFIIDENEFWLSKTVLLEVDWVLQSRYKLQPVEAIHAIRTIAGHKNAHVEDAEGVLAALALFDHGIEFADALHLTTLGTADGFITFDTKLVRRAHKAGLHAVIQA